MSDRIWLRDCRFQGRHGVLRQEREQPQWFTVSIEVWLDVRPAAEHGDLHATVDYRHLWRAAQQVMEGPPERLLETLAERIAQNVLREAVQRVRVCVEKLDPPVGGPTAAAGVEVVRDR
jgi:dihydroneopterin aldolase